MTDKVNRKMIKINSELCDGCGICAKSCNEGAIAVISGKARLVKDSYCDGFGECISGCPRHAITFEIREADDFEKTAACPGSENSAKHNDRVGEALKRNHTLEMHSYSHDGKTIQRIAAVPSHTLPALRNWPVQMKLIPDDAPYLKNAGILVAADCSAFACPTFHSEILPGKVCMVACPKLDNMDPYTDKLTQIIKKKGIRSIEVIYMEVPCCDDLFNMVRTSVLNSGAPIPIKRTRLSLEGVIIECEWL